MRLRFLVVLLLLSGCSFFSKSKSTFYSLERIPPVAPPPATMSGTPVSIESIELPPGFDRREIVVRQADHKMDVRSSQQWSAGFQDMVLHTLAFDLASRLPEGKIILPGQLKPTGGVRTIDVVIEDFAAGPQNSVVLDAQWVLAGVSHHEQIAINIASLDSAQIATGYSQAIAELATRMAAGVNGNA